MGVSLIQVPDFVKAAVFGISEWPSRFRRDRLVPPLYLRRIIGEQHTYTVDNALLLRRYCGLTESCRVLDVGCGCGSLAYSLIRRYNFKGRYEGFDIVKPFIIWLRANVSARYPNYHFQHCNVFNPAYNKQGAMAAADYHFPYPTGSFDVVALFSVFTHMLPTDLTHYLHEVSRVLKPDGRALISYFLLSEDRPKTLKDAAIRQQFKDTGKGYHTTNLNCPEDAVAYPKSTILAWQVEAGLRLAHPIIYGATQDFVVLQKAGVRV